MKCNDCNGTGKIMLLYTEVDCEKCKSLVGSGFKKFIMPCVKQKIGKVNFRYALENFIEIEPLPEPKCKLLYLKNF